MPRPQRSRQGQSPHLDALPYRKKTACTRRRRRSHLLDDGTAASLSDDALAVIFGKLPDTAGVVRCAATCARWGHVVATSAADISRALPPLGRFLPQLAVGVFHLQRDGPTPRTRTTPGAPQPRFLAMPSGRRLLLGRRQGTSADDVLPLGSLFSSNCDAADAIFDYSSPIASRNGRLVLELRRDSRADSLIRLCVCSPMAGDVVVLPPVSISSSSSSGSGKKRVTNYRCALLTGDDLHPRRCAKLFWLLLVYKNDDGQRSFTALRCYSSSAGRWGAESKSAVDVSSRELLHMHNAAVVLRGVAFWPLDHGALGKRLGVSPDNRLFLMYIGCQGWSPACVRLIAMISYLDIPEAQGGGGDIQKEESRSSNVPMHQMKMEWRDFKLLRLRWVGEKSGLVVFTIGSGQHTGTHVLNLRERTVEKLADDGHSWGNLVGFEMDMAAYLASLTHGQ
ncbi:hypothetical protein BS78_03G013300 [Paspalum vaginatum]|nr:hypothetical protein BS78_03G013300 [Paspalum vaginatum]